MLLSGVDSAARCYMCSLSPPLCFFLLSLSLSVSPPRSPPPLSSRAEKFKRIEKENRILLEKMSKIMQGSQTLDNRLTQKNVPRSMNKTARRKDLERITNKNYQMLRRIQNKAPFYSHSKWDHEYKQHKRYVKNISYYKGKKRQGGTGSRSQTRWVFCC